MRIKPLTGQVLVFLLPKDDKEGSIFLPQSVMDGKSSPDNVYVKLKPRKAVVQEVGPWKKTKQGLAVLPPVKRGDTVIVSQYKGQKITTDVREQLMLVNSDDLLAILTDSE